MCTTKDIGELFMGKPDELVICFDDIITLMESWKPNTYGASINTVVFTSKKAWLVVKPMKKELDLKFYYSETLTSPLIHKSYEYSGKQEIHVRINSTKQVNAELIKLLRMGFDFSLF